MKRETSKGPSHVPGRIEPILKNNASVYRLVLENIDQGLCIIDTSGHFLFVNEVMQTRSGYPEEWFRKNTCLDMVRPEDRNRMQTCMATVMSGKPVPTFELIYHDASGKTILVELQFKSLFENGEVAGAFAITRDITERRRMEEEVTLYRNNLEALVAERTRELTAVNAQLQREIDERVRTEEALRNSESFYKMVFETTGTAMVVMEEDTTIALANTECKKFVGYSAEQLEKGRKALEFVAQQDLQRVLDYKRLRASDPEKAPRSYEFQMIDRFGNRKDLYMTVALMPETRKIVASFIDVTERKKIEAALKQSEEKYRNIFENITEGVFRMSPEGRFIDANPAFAKLFGYSSPKELLSSVKDIWYELYADAEERGRLKGLLEKHGIVRNFEIQCRTRNGTKIWISTNLRTVRDKSGKILFYEGTLTDISERRKIQEDLEAKSISLEETNAALKVLLKHREQDTADLEEKVVHNMKELVLPYLERLRKTSDKDRPIVEIIESNVNDILSPFLRNMAGKYIEFTPKEIQVADLMKKGKTTKEISQILCLSTRTIDIHRYNIRKKLNLTKKRISLQSYLLTLS